MVDTLCGLSVSLADNHPGDNSTGDKLDNLPYRKYRPEITRPLPAPTRGPDPNPNPNPIRPTGRGVI